MARYIGKRVLMLIPVLLGIALIVLLLIDITPGDPARIMLGTMATEEQVKLLRAEWGLDDPFPVRYVRYIWQVLHGDFGKSFMTKRSVSEEILQRFPYTLTLAALSITLSIILGIPIGIYAATHQYSWRDNAAMFTALIVVSMPSFWLALMLIRVFGVNLRWLPISGITTWKGWILPCVAMALGLTALLARQMRSDLLEVIRQDYITTARAKGLAEGTVVYRHGLKNAVIPIIMVIGGVFGSSLSGAIIAETIYSIPGIGSFTLTGLSNRDYPVIQGSVLIMSSMFAIVILFVDVLFALVDPRIRSQYSGKRKREEKQLGKETQEKVETV